MKTTKNHVNADRGVAAVLPPDLEELPAGIVL
jgi:hypothetical protein